MNEEYNYYPIVPDTTSNSGVLPSDLDKIKPNTEAVAPTDSNIVPSGNGTVMNTGQLQSPNFVVGSSGWIIRADGTAEFGYLVIRNGSRIANWYVNTNTISSGSVEATSGILLDSANSIIRVGSTAGNYITIDGPNFRFRSSNYVAGVSGFTIEPNLIEAENIVARGTLRGVTFKYDVISAVGGQLMVANSDSLASDTTALDSATFTTKGDSTFAVNDILVLRAVTASGIQEEWLRVTNVGSAPTYTVTRDLAGSFGANANPVWKAGTALVKQGVSDGAASYSGGWLRLLGEGTNSPYYSVFARTGIAYNSYTEAVRLGNLNGIGSYVADTYGIYIGNITTGNYLTYDTISGNLVVNDSIISNQDIFGDGADGDVTISADTSLSSDMFYNNLTIQTTFTLNPNGYRIFVKGTLTTQGTGKIARNGNDGGNGANATGFVGGQGAGGTAGGALADGSIKGAISGKNGVTGVTGVVAMTNAVAGTAGTTGTAGTSVAKSLVTLDGTTGTNGGLGGNGTTLAQGTGTGQAGGTGAGGGTRTGTVYNLIHNAIAAYRLYDDNGTAFLTAAPSNGSGGSGGSGGAASAQNNSAGSGSTGGSGASGGQGGIVLIFARKIVNAGTISANGGIGGNAGTTFNSAAPGPVNEAAGGSGGSAGGNGGNGGVVVLVYSTLTNTGTIQTAGGVGGTKSVGRAAATFGTGTGTAGADGVNGITGNAGVVIQIIV